MLERKLPNKSPHQARPSSDLPRYVPVPLFSDTLFPIDPDSSCFTRLALPDKQPQQQYQLILPTVAWLDALRNCPLQEHDLGKAGGTITFWHSTDYPNRRSYGWRDRSVPSLGTFEPLLDKSVLSRCAPQLAVALRRFEAKLARTWSRQELADHSPLMASFQPDVRRDNLRFFFSTDLTADGAILLTVFLEATTAELQGRPRLYKNCNKHLHQSFFTSDGIVRRSPSHHGREVRIANSTEHTAYAKFYLRGWRMEDPKCVSIMLHPAQRARLAYEPHNDARYNGIRSLLHREAARCARWIGKMEHEGNTTASRAFAHIRDRLHELSALARSQHFSVVQAQDVERDIIHALRDIPRDRRLYQVMNGEQSCWAHRRIRALVQTAIHVTAMHQRRVLCHEVEYQIADQVTGPQREQLFFAVMDLLRESLKESGLGGYRFLLSSQQIAQLRLAREDGNVREKIAALPLLLEKRFPTVSTLYPMQRVDSLGNVSAEFTRMPISTISLDTHGEIAPNVRTS